MSKIEWTDRTINPGIYGCTKVSPACEHCYASRMAKRQIHMGTSYANHPDIVDERGEWTGAVYVDYDRIGPAFATLPKRPRKDGRRLRVFVTSMADLFHKDVPGRFIGLVFGEMRARPHIDFQVLTKRTKRMAEWWEADGRYQGFGAGWPANVWAGTTVEDQRRADERIPHLLRVPAGVRFLSCEPLLGPLDLSHFVDWMRFIRWCDKRGPEGEWSCSTASPPLSWVIAGGESGPKSRPTHPAWFRSLRDQCGRAGVPFLFKQWGAWAPGYHLQEVGYDRPGWYEQDPADGGLPRRLWPGTVPYESFRVGKKAAGRLLDGREHNGFPA